MKEKNSSLIKWTKIHSTIWIQRAFETIINSSKISILYLTQITEKEFTGINNKTFKDETRR